MQKLQHFELDLKLCEATLWPFCHFGVKSTCDYESSSKKLHIEHVIYINASLLENSFFSNISHVLIMLLF